MMNDILRGRSKGKILTEYDIPELRHYFIMFYGSDLWNSIDLDKFFDLLPELNKEIGRKEDVRLCLLKMCGVKNPK